MSWHKQFNIVDLGKLGSPIMAKIKNTQIIADYYYDFAAPDIIETHAYWSCQYYDSLFSDNRFREMYSPRQKRWVTDTKTHKECGDTKLPVGVWVRNDIVKDSDSAERKLIDDLQNTLSVKRLSKELDSCQKNLTRNCVYVARTAYRFLPEFIAHGHHGELMDILNYSRTKDFDLYLVNGVNDGQAHIKAVDFLKEMSRL